MHIDPNLLAVARGDRPADLLLRGGRVVNVFTRRVEPGAVALCGDRIARVGRGVDAAEIVDVDGATIAPGFIDAHMHVESTMMLPPQFVLAAAPHGTTGVVLDPHEIANVLGVPGIRFLMDQAAGLPMNIMFAVPSCVPCSPLETAGAEVGPADVRELLDDHRVVALAEMMNYPGVIAAVPDVIEKVAAGLERRIVDGHCPGLRGAGLQAYAAAGISSDHESTTADEAREKLALGMRIFLREGSAARNLEALLPAVTPETAHRFCFCTDDRHPRDLLERGHLDHVLRTAIGLGMDPVLAICIATLHAAEHYRRPDLGAVAPGRFADLVVLDDLDDPRPRLVYHHGRLVARDGNVVDDDAWPRPAAPGEDVRGTVRLPDGLGPESLRVPATGDGPIRVIGLRPHRLETTELRLLPCRERGALVADPSIDLLKMAVIERHRGTGNIGLGFVHGFGLDRGAIAGTVAHDSHNLSVVGVDDGDMIIAARALAEAGGGQCVVSDGTVRALLPLPIAGLLSDLPPEALVSRQRELHEAARAIGCPLEDPFMPLSFLSLTVIPHLKLGDRGLVDVDAFEIVGLEV